MEWSQLEPGRQIVGPSDDKAKEMEPFQDPVEPKGLWVGPRHQALNFLLNFDLIVSMP